MELAFEVYFWLWLLVFGACIGSFINVVVYRLPKGNFWDKARSYCPSCGNTLKPRDLIPVLSYVMLKGRCRSCGERISLRYPIVEAACALLAAACYLRFGLNARLAVSFGVSVILLAILLSDLDTLTIPDSLVIALIPFAVFAVWVFELPLPERVIGFFAVSLPMLVLALIINDAFGGGDIKLMAVCGFLLGVKGVLLAFFVALLTGGGYACYLLASGKGKRGAHIAFGPYLCVGVVVSMFYGAEIVRFYLNLYM